MIELAMGHLFSGAKVGTLYRVGPQTAYEQLLKMAKENNAYLTITAAE